MKHLIIYAHPNPKSFCAGILARVESASKSRGDEVMVRDLYAMGFNPVLTGKDIVSFRQGGLATDIVAEQEQIKWAELITFVYPVWWTGMPAIMKGYVDRVFSYGFAYRYGEKGVEGLLADKKVILFSTSGTPQEVYEKSGMFESMNRTSDDGIFRFCGIESVNHVYFSGMGMADDSARQEMLSRTEKAVLEVS